MLGGCAKFVGLIPHVAKILFSHIYSQKYYGILYRCQLFFVVAMISVSQEMSIRDKFWKCLVWYSLLLIKKPTLRPISFRYVCYGIH